MSNESSVCQAAKILSGYPILLGVIGVKIVFCFLGIVLTVFHAKKQGISWLAHPNAKVLYSFHIFWAVYVPATYSVAFGTDLFRFLSDHPNSCDYTISSLWGVTLRALPVLGLVSQSLTMFSFAVERIIATLSPVSYEKVKSPILGIVLGVLSFGCSCYVLYYLLVPVNWDTILPMTAVRTAENGSNYQTFLSTYTYVETTTISVFTITLVINYFTSSRASTLAVSLSNKYQVNENKHLIITLLPCFLVHCVLNLIPILGLKLYYLLFAFEQGSYAAWAELWTQAQMYALVMPLIIYLRLKWRRRKEVTDVHNTETHFGQLDAIFNKRT